MGTDIHLYVERKNMETGRWERVSPPDPPPASERTKKRRDGSSYVDPWWGPGGCMFAGYGPQSERNATQWYQNRNYSVFAILSGTVRNGYGFAGVSTGQGFVGITEEPRGLPDDISDEVRDNNSWDHSES